MTRTARHQQLFELFNEISIIAQLAGTEFNRRLPDGLHVSHFGVLNHLVRLGDGKTPVAIASAFQVTKPTMTHTLGKLEGLGYIELRQNPDDRRSKQVFLTEAGRQFRDEAIAGLAPLMEQLAGSLDADEMLGAVPALRTLRRWLDDHRSPASNSV